MFLQFRVVAVEVVEVVEVVLLNKDSLLVCYLDPSGVGYLPVVLRHEILRRVLLVVLQEVRRLGVLQMVLPSCLPDDVRPKCLKCLLVHRYQGSD